MRKGLVIMVLVFAVVAVTGYAQAANTFTTYEFPVATNPQMGTANGEAIQITFGPGGAVSTAVDAAIGHNGYTGTTDYAGSNGDDVAVAFINNSGGAINSIQLTGHGNGGGLFAWDSDDNFGTSGITITGIHQTVVASDTGTVNFNGLLNAGSGEAVWWDFESAPSTIDIPGLVTPEPATFLLFGGGLLALAAYRKRFGKA
jgi:hypothetical protein